MKLSRLITYSFPVNVGTKDRLFRILSGLSVAVFPWLFNMPLRGALTITILGTLWLITGVVSRCSIYYIFGLSTKKQS